MIELTNIGKMSNDNVILDNINLTINSNDFIVITGPSGSGKTSLLNLIGGISKPTSGTYTFDGKLIDGVKSRDNLRLNDITFIVQDFALINDLTVKDNLKLVNKKIDNSILKELNIEDKLKTKVKKLSGGEKQRCAFARAILSEKNVYLCDEPTGSLDSNNAHVIMSMLQKLHENGNTIILVTHNTDYFDIGNRKITLKDGMILENE